MHSPQQAFELTALRLRYKFGLQEIFQAARQASVAERMGVEALRKEVKQNTLYNNSTHTEHFIDQ